MRRSSHLSMIVPEAEYSRRVSVCREREVGMIRKNPTVAGQNEGRCDLTGGQEPVTQGFAGYSVGYRFYSKCNEKPQGL